MRGLIVDGDDCCGGWFLLGDDDSAGSKGGVYIPFGPGTNY